MPRRGKHKKERESCQFPEGDQELRSPKLSNQIPFLYHPAAPSHVRRAKTWPLVPPPACRHRGAAPSPSSHIPGVGAAWMNPQPGKGTHTPPFSLFLRSFFTSQLQQGQTAPLRGSPGPSSLPGEELILLAAPGTSFSFQHPQDIDFFLLTCQDQRCSWSGCAQTSCPHPDTFWLTRETLAQEVFRCARG